MRTEREIEIAQIRLGEAIEAMQDAAVTAGVISYTSADAIDFSSMLQTLVEILDHDAVSARDIEAARAVLFDDGRGFSATFDDDDRSQSSWTFSHGSSRTLS